MIESQEFMDDISYIPNNEENYDRELVVNETLMTSDTHFFNDSSSLTESFNDSTTPVVEIEEDNALTQFQLEWAKKLDKKCIEQNQIANAAKEKALLDIEKFYTQRDALKESKQAANRTEEQATMEKLVANLEIDNPWERVVTLIELEKKKTGDALAVNSRMKQVFIQLKNMSLESTRKGITAH